MESFRLKDQNTESVAVVGAGIVGIAAAHYLHKAGFQVTVIDKAGIGSGCSHANCGYVCPSHILPLAEPGAIMKGLRSLLNPAAPFRIKPQLRPEFWYWLWQFARRCNRRQMLRGAEHLKVILDASASDYKDLFSENDIAAERQENGLAYIFQTETGMQAFADRNKMLNMEFGVSATHISSSELVNFDPALRRGLAGGFYHETDSSLRSDQLCASWSKLLASKGVQFLEHQEYLGLEKSGKRINGITTTSDTLIADHFLFAVGAWSRKLEKDLNCSIPVEPGKGYSITMDRPDTCPHYPMLFPEAHVGVTPYKNSLRVGSMMEFCGFNTSIPKKRVEQLRHASAQFIKYPAETPIRESWFGWRPMTWDSLPIVGQAPNLDNAWLATGHNMLGLSLAPATGRLIAELLGNRDTTIDPSPYSPNRF